MQLAPNYGTFLRLGFASVGDAGEALYTTNSTVCSLNSGAGDGGSQIGLTSGGSSYTGCALIDWASVSNVATPMLFESFASATDDTAAIAAIAACVATTYPCHIPGMSREWIVSSDIPVVTQDQLVYGDGLRKTRLRVNSNAGFRKGVFVYSTGEPGPAFRDLGVYFTQPNSSSLSAMTQYVPAFYAENTPRARWENVGTYACWTCYDWTGGGGGNYLINAEMSAFQYGLTVDGHADTDRIINPHWYPFNLQPNSVILFTTGTGIGLNIARADDLKVIGGLFFGATAINLSPAATFVTVDGTECDTFTCATVAGGSLNFTGGTASFLAGNGRQVFSQSAGILKVHDSYIVVGQCTAADTLQCKGAYSPSGSSDYIFSLTGGLASITGNTINMGAVDTPAYVQAGNDLPDVVFSTNTIIKNSGTSYTRAVATFASGNTTAVGNEISDLSSGQTGTAFAVGNDNGHNRFGLNRTVGWPAWQPSSPQGIYGLNY